MLFVKKTYFIACVLYALMCMQTFQYGISFLIFKIEQDNIAKTLCVQKDIEDNECQGHCQLEKKLEQNIQQQIPEENNTNKLSISFEIKEYVIVCFKYIIDYTLTTFFLKLKPTFESTRVLEGFNNNIFKPPID